MRFIFGTCESTNNFLSATTFSSSLEFQLALVLGSPSFYHISPLALPEVCCLGASSLSPVSSVIKFRCGASNICLRQCHIFLYHLMLNKEGFWFLVHQLMNELKSGFSGG